MDEFWILEIVYIISYYVRASHIKALLSHKSPKHLQAQVHQSGQLLQADSSTRIWQFLYPKINQICWFFLPGKRVAYYLMTHCFCHSILQLLDGLLITIPGPEQHMPLSSVISPNPCQDEFTAAWNVSMLQVIAQIECGLLLNCLHKLWDTGTGWIWETRPLLKGGVWREGGLELF